jgi:NitT/TauT family transport system substrate-binding protein
VRMQRRVLLGVGVVLLGMLVACAPASAPAKPTGSGGAPAGGASAPAAGAPSSSAPAAPTGAAGSPALTIPNPPERTRMSFAGQAAHFATVWVAKDTGLFEKYGIDAEVTFLPSRQASTALVTGDVDYGFFSGRTVVELRAQGTDAVAVAGPILKVFQSIIVQPDIRQPADLRGKKMAVTGFGSIVDFAGRYLLKQWSLRPDEDVTMLQLQTTTNILAGLEGKAIDAGVLSPPTSLQAVAMGYRELGNMQSQPFDYPASVVVVRANTLRENPDQVRRVVRAVIEAIARIKQDRPGTEASIGRYTGIDDAESLRQTYDLYAPAFERLPLLTEAAMQAAVDELAEETPAAREIRPAATLDMRFVKEFEAAGILRELYPQ